MTKPFGTVITLLVVAFISTSLFIAYGHSSVEDGNTLRRAAFFASPFAFVAIGTLVAAFVVAIRHRRDLIQILVGFLLLAVGVVGGVLSMAMIMAFSLRGDDPGALIVVIFAIALLCVVLGVFLLVRWFARYARSVTREKHGPKT